MAMELVRYRVVVKYAGAAKVVLGVELFASAAVSAAFAEGGVFYVLYLGLGAVCAGAGAYLYRSVPERTVTTPEAMVIASASFLAASLAGAVPFAVLARMPVIDAWFESMSGFTTTGFSLLDVGTAPSSILFFRALSQWLGGMGFVMITVSMLVITGRSAVTFVREDPLERASPRVASHLRVIAATYTALTALGFVALVAAGLSPFDSLCYTLAGVSTGGFAVHGGSVGQAGGLASSSAVILIMLSGASSLVLYYRCWQKGPGVAGAVKAFFRNPQVLLLLAFTAGGGVLLAISSGGTHRFFDGVFLAASAQTTTGYFTTDPALLPARALLVAVGLMFVGGSMGSTAGGIKIFRLREAAAGFNRFISSELYPKEVVLPGASYAPGGPGASPDGRVVTKEELSAILYVIAVYVLVIFAASLVFVWSGYGAVESVFEVTSAASTVGLSAGITAPGLAGGLKVLLIFLMWAGRLEFIPVIVWGYAVIRRRRVWAGPGSRTDA